MGETEDRLINMLAGSIKFTSLLLQDVVSPRLEIPIYPTILHKSLREDCLCALPIEKGMKPYLSQHTNSIMHVYN